jgi:hypothetical protein
MSVCRAPDTRSEGDSRKYLPLGSPRLPLMSLCMLVRTLKKSASRRSMARAKEVTDSTAAGSESSQQSRIVCCLVLCCVAFVWSDPGCNRSDDKPDGGLGTVIQMK